jgi:quercetin dioxygenase-like cupin family protein
MKIVEKADSKEFIIGDITGYLPFSSRKMTFLLARIPPRGILAEHSHPHEQMGICLKGKAEFIAGEEKKMVEEGMLYWTEP